MSLITKAGTIVCLCGAKALMEDDVHDVQYVMLDIITCRCAFCFPQKQDILHQAEPTVQYASV